MYELPEKRFILSESIGVIIILAGAVISLIGTKFDVLTMMCFFISGAAIARNGRRKQTILEMQNCEFDDKKKSKAKKWIDSKQRKADTFVIKFITPIVVIVGFIVYQYRHNYKILILLFLVLVIAVYDFFVFRKHTRMAKQIIKENKGQ